MTRLVAPSDSSPTAWIVAALQTFGVSLLSLLPHGFAAYVRLFHPARRSDGGQVRWDEIAAANGTHAHAGMQLAGLTGRLRNEDSGQEGVYDVPPKAGSLPQELRSELRRVLTRHTATPDRCWFAVWTEFGAMRDDARLGTLKVGAWR